MRFSVARAGRINVNASGCSERVNGANVGLNILRGPLGDSLFEGGRKEV